MSVAMFSLPARAAHAGPDPATDWRGWHDTISAEVRRDPAAVMDRLRLDLADARQRGDRHLEWMALAYLSEVQAFTSLDASPTMNATYRQAMHDAREAGDTDAVFHLILMMGWAQAAFLQADLPEALMNEARDIARSLGDPARTGLLERMLGFVAAGRGLHGEALAHYRVAMDSVKGAAPRAELLCLIARSIVASQANMDALKAAESDLREAIRLLDPSIYLGFSLPYVILTGLYLQMDRPAQAVTAGRLALSTSIGGHESAGRLAELRVNLAVALVAQHLPAAALEELDKLDPATLSAKYRLQMRLAQAEAAALLNRPDAANLLLQAQQLLPNASAVLNESVWRYHDTAARIYRLSGDFGAALDAMAAAATARRTITEQANQRLYEARLDEAAKARENELLRLAQTASEQRRNTLIVALAGATIGLAALGLLLVHLARVMRQLRQAHQRLIDANASRTKWLASACHDLRQPAHALGMLAELVRPREGEVARDSEQIEEMCRASALLSGMLDSLMDMTQLESGRYQARSAAIRLQDILREVEMEYGALARNKGLAMWLPACADWVKSDPYLLRRIVFNLVSNAIKYTTSGSVTISVDSEATDTTLLTVCDTGVGIPADRIDDIFGDYVRLDEGLAEGLGIGLSIVRRGAQLLGHRLSVSSRPGHGTAMTLSLPRAAPTSDREPALRVAQGEWVAIIDDDPVIRSSTAEVLRRHGYQVVAAAARAQLAQAMQQAGCERPRVVLSDLHLSGADGLSELAELRREPGWKDVQAVLLTGDLDQAVMERAAAMGVTVAHKPMPPDRLLRQVGELARSTAG